MKLKGAKLKSHPDALLEPSAGRISAQPVCSRAGIPPQPHTNPPNPATRYSLFSVAKSKDQQPSSPASSGKFYSKRGKKGKKKKKTKQTNKRKRDSYRGGSQETKTHWMPLSEYFLKVVGQERSPQSHWHPAETRRGHQTGVLQAQPRVTLTPSPRRPGIHFSQQDVKRSNEKSLLRRSLISCYAISGFFFPLCTH